MTRSNRSRRHHPSPPAAALAYCLAAIGVVPLVGLILFYAVEAHSRAARLDGLAGVGISAGSPGVCQESVLHVHHSKGYVMRTTYRVLAYLVAAEVVIQAAAIAYALFGFFKFVDDGAVIDKSTQESGVTFDGLVGFIVHGINGTMIVPLLALVLLVVSFFAKVPGGGKWAGILLGLVVAQVLLGIFAHELPWLGGLHGLNALAVFSVALLAAHRPSGVQTPTAANSDAETATV
jgi:hypothetical protein